MDGVDLATMEAEHGEDVFYFSGMVSGEASVETAAEGGATPRRSYKLVKSPEEARAAGVRVTSRLFGDDQREFIVKKSAAPKD